MRVELVIELPDIHNPDAVDAVRVGLEAVRILRNDTGTAAELVHAAVGNGIAVPRDYDEDAPVLSVESTDIVHDPSASSPHSEDIDSNVTTPYVTAEQVAALQDEAAQVYAADLNERVAAWRAADDDEPFVFLPADDDLLALLAVSGGPGEFGREVAADEVEPFEFTPTEHDEVEAPEVE